MIARRVPSTTLLHDDVATLVGGSVGLTDVLVAEIAKDVFYHILELEP